MLRRNRFWVVMALSFAVAASAWVAWRIHQKALPRRSAIQAAQRLEVALRGSSDADLLAELAVPSSMQSRTPVEQGECGRKALRDELSTEGLRAMARSGTFGPLMVVFPSEGPQWAGQAGLDPASCVAFRMDRNEVTAELVVVTNAAFWKVVRCNNVKQMVAP